MRRYVDTLYPLLANAGPCARTPADGAVPIQTLGVAPDER